MTLYHVPHLALGAELSTDYQERTSVVVYRLFFQIAGTALVFLLGRSLFLGPTDSFPNGQLNIFHAIEDELGRARARFEWKHQKRFKLS